MWSSLPPFSPESPNESLLHGILNMESPLSVLTQDLKNNLQLSHFAKTPRRCLLSALQESGNESLAGDLQERQIDADLSSPASSTMGSPKASSICSPIFSPLRRKLVLERTVDKTDTCLTIDTLNHSFGFSSNLNSSRLINLNRLPLGSKAFAKTNLLPGNMGSSVSHWANRQKLVVKPKLARHNTVGLVPFI